MEREREINPCVKYMHHFTILEQTKYKLKTSLWSAQPNGPNPAVPEFDRLSKLVKRKLFLYTVTNRNALKKG